MSKKLLGLALFLALALAACAPAAPATIKIGVNAEITGDIPKVGECTK
jgi:hypothetical protein